MLIGLVYAAAGVFVAASVRLAMLLLPGARTVRARNSFLLTRRPGSALDWSPDHVPDDFRVGEGPATHRLEAALREVGIHEIHGDRERALAIVGYLLRNAGGGGGIRSDLIETFRGIQRGKGYCADYVRVYLIAASSLGLCCRRWAFTFDGFGDHGHTFAEVFDRGRRQWMFVDVFNNVYATRAGSETPLGAVELRSELVGNADAVRFVPASSARAGYRYHEKLLEYYRRGVREWLVWWGNDEAARENAGAARFLRPISRRLAYRLVTGALTAPRLVVAEPADQAALARMSRLRRHVVRAGSVAIGSGAILALLLLLAELAE